MNPENSIETNTINSQTNSNYKKSIFSKVKNAVIQVFSKIKNVWLKIPQKIRVIITPVILVAFLGGIYLLTQNPFNEIKKFVQKDLAEQYSEGWTKMQIPQRETPFFTLKAQTQSKYGILSKETFTLTTKKPVDESFLQENLRSNVPIKITSSSSTEFRLATAGDLGNDEIVSLSIPVKDVEIGGHVFDRNYSWAFQTQGKFRIMSSIPGNEKTNVPLNTGIEITFSQDDYKNPDKFISIEPAIEWRGEKHSETYAIIPLKPLDPKIVYTVTLKKGLNLESRNDPIGEDFSFSFQTQELIENQNKTRPPRMSLNKSFIQTSINEPPAVSVYTSNWNSELNLKTKIYKFTDNDQFLKSRTEIDKTESSWYSYFAEDEQVNTANLAKISEMDLKVQKRDNLEYIQLPYPLSYGSYLIQFWYEDGKKLEQLWLQSTKISAYTSIGRKQTLIWVNNIESGEPLGSSQISIIDSGSAYSTSDNGIVVFSTPQTFYDESIHYIKVSKDDQELVLPIKLQKENTNAQEKNASDYWSYLYNERHLYKPGDSVYFWGVIKDRDTNSTPGSVEIRISAGYHYPYSENASVLKSINVTPDSSGAFIGNISLTDIPKGYYSLSLVVNGIEIKSNSIQITDYEKPEMKIEVTSSKKAIFSTEKNDFTAKVSFFDETPAKQIPLNVYTNNIQTEITSDKNGEIKYTYEPRYEEENSRNSSYSIYPRYESITINPALAQDSNIEGFGSVYVYGSKLMITSESRQEGGKAFLNATLNKVSLDNINQGISSNVKGETVANKEIGAVITKTWWEKIEEGTYYDFIEKTTHPSYKYQRHDEKVLDTKIKTDGNGKISYEFDMEKDKSYHMVLSVNDEDKHPTFANEYYYYYEGYQNYSSYYPNYSEPEITLDKEENSYSVGENVNLSIKLKDQNYPDNDKNRFLFILAQRGNQDFFVKDDPQFSFTFDNKHIPNTHAAAVIFTGKYYQVAGPRCSWDWGCSYSYYYSDYFSSIMIRYKNEDSSLELELKSDKEKYKPGDAANISVSVKKDEQAVSDAQVNLVLVDQALEAIGGVKKPAVLSSLYTAVPNEIYYNYYSHKPVFPPPSQAERGGGGGEAREIFKDTPFFGQAKTNQDGVANFEFTLPDNITTWLIYAQALSNDLDAGQNEGKIISTKDFFVTGNFPKEYLHKDESFITGNGFGNNISQNQIINYEVTLLQNESEIDKQSGEGKTLQDTSFKLPQLSTGEYRAWLKGTTGDLVDGVIYPFKVIGSRLDMQMNKKYKIEKQKTLDSFELPGLNNDKAVKIVISDIGRGRYYYQLFGFCHAYSNRIEKTLAKSKANSVISQRFEEEPCKVKKEELSVYQNYDGGLSQVSWGGSVLETTVWAIYVDPSVFDKEKLVSYLEGKLNEGNAGNIQKIYALWGLTLLDRPHINELTSYVQNSTSYDEKIIGSIALASIGETEIPHEIYFDLLADYAYTSKPYIRIQTHPINGQNVDDYVKNTGLMLLLGSMVEKEYNEALYLYVRDYQNQVEDIVLDLGKIAFINEELGKLPQEDTQVTLKSNSREETIDLSKGKSKSISLLKNEITETYISANLGKAEVSVFYFVTPDVFSQIPQDARLKVKREYKKVKGVGNTINPGDILEIRVDFDLDLKEAPLGSYIITDHLASGLTYIENPGMYGLTREGWARQVTNNVIKYSFYNSPWWQSYGRKYFTYYARASAVGSYIAEPCIIQSNLDLSVIKSTPEETIKIESKN